MRSCRLFFSVLLMGISTTSRSYSADLTCVFDDYYAADLSTKAIKPFQRKPAHLQIVDGRTSDSTLKLDGALRATNSTRWERVGTTPFNQVFAGDAGEILNILNQAGGDSYLASLQFSSLRYAYTFFGNCESDLDFE